MLYDGQSEVCMHVCACILYVKHGQIPALGRGVQAGRDVDMQPGVGSHPSGLPCPAEEPASASPADPPTTWQEPCLSTAAQAQSVSCIPAQRCIVQAGNTLQGGSSDTEGHSGMHGHASTAGDSVECVVCWEAEACVVFHPCGHLCTCERCADACTSTDATPCPLCRTPVITCIAVAEC